VKFWPHLDFPAWVRGLKGPTTVDSKSSLRSTKGLLQRLKCMWANEGLNSKYTHKFIHSENLLFLYCSPHPFTMQCSKLLLQKIIIKTFKLVWQTKLYFHITQTATDQYPPDGSSQHSLISHPLRSISI